MGLRQFADEGDNGGVETMGIGRSGPRNDQGRDATCVPANMEAGAVIGHQFDLDLVRHTSGRNEGEVVDALATLLARQVISEFVNLLSVRTQRQQG